MLSPNDGTVKETYSGFDMGSSWCSVGFGWGVRLDVLVDFRKENQMSVWECDYCGIETDDEPCYCQDEGGQELIYPSSSSGSVDPWDAWWYENGSKSGR